MGVSGALSTKPRLLFLHEHAPHAHPLGISLQRIPLRCERVNGLLKLAYAFVLLKHPFGSMMALDAPFQREHLGELFLQAHHVPLGGFLGCVLDRLLF